MPLALSDDELDIVLALAKPLPPENRDGFLRAIAAELAAHGMPIGPGAVHRVARALQRHYLTPTLGPIPRFRI